MWAHQTYWVQETPLRRAIVMDEDESIPEGSLPVLRATAQVPCSTCPAQMACMDSIWADGKRLGGPTRDESSVYTEVMRCTYCAGPKLFTFRSGLTPAPPNECPRASMKVGHCDECRKVMDEHAARPDPTFPASWDVASKLIEVLVGEDYVPEGKKSIWTRETARAVESGLRPEDIVRMLILGLPDGSEVETKWVQETSRPALRRFALSNWAGRVRGLLAG